MITKKQLQNKFGIARTTVLRTLNACALATSRRYYTPAEVELFRYARLLFEAGHSAEKVSQYVRVFVQAKKIDEGRPYSLPKGDK